MIMLGFVHHPNLLAELSRMIFGIKEDFAIESIVEPELIVPSAVWGRMSIWINNKSFGDIEDPYCALYPAYHSLNEASKNIDLLWHEIFSKMENSDIFYFFDELLYSHRGDIYIDDDRSAEDCGNDWDKYGKFNFLTNWGEMFDGCGKGFILSPPGEYLRILIYDNECHTVNTFQCSKFSFRKAIILFSDWYESQRQLLSGK